MLRGKELRISDKRKHLKTLISFNGVRHLGCTKGMSIFLLSPILITPTGKKTFQQCRPYKSIFERGFFFIVGYARGFEKKKQFNSSRVKLKDT